jgi:PAS domain S-box-containing protein
LLPCGGLAQAYGRVAQGGLESVNKSNEAGLDQQMNASLLNASESKFRSKLIAGFALAVILTCLLGFLSWRGAQQAAEDADWVAHTNEVSMTLEATLRHLVDVESGGRGFVLTGHPAFLEPYETGKNAVGKDLLRLRLLSVDNADQQRRLDTLEKQANARIEAAGNVVTAGWNARQPPSEAQLELGKQLMDAARATIAEMEGAENRLLEQRMERARATQRFNQSLIATGALLGLAFLSLAAVVVNREIGNSTRARAEVISLNADLGRRVEERTTALLSEIQTRKDAEDEIKKQAALLELAHDAIIVRDLESRVVFWNRGAQHLYGWSAGEARSQVTHDLLQTRFPLPLAEIEAALASKGDWEGELGHWTHHGAEVVVASRWSLQRDESGLPTRILEINRDITQKRAAELEIRKLNENLEERIAQRTMQLESANRELEAFTYSVSHDLRAPLRHIQGFAGALLDEFGATVDPQALHYLTRIQDGTRRMGILIGELLNLARTGKQPLCLQPTELVSIVHETIAMLNPEAGGREVEWKIGDLPLANCDPVLVRQIFQNLLANAIKYTRPRARAVIEVGHKQEGDRIVIFVRDNGVGFDMQYADKLFGVFQRLHRDEDFEGTGVGLATVYRIVQKHGGRVWTEAEVDRGATFYFTLDGNDTPISPRSVATAEV